MYLKVCLLILLISPSVQQRRKTPVCAVAGEWQLDKVRSPHEEADDLVWTIKIRKRQVVWAWEETKDGKITPYKYAYKVGDSMGRSKDGRVWKQYVEFDETRLRVWTRIFKGRRDALVEWSIHEFEVKDHGYTLYHRWTRGEDVAAHKKILYFRPLEKKKE